MQGRALAARSPPLLSIIIVIMLVYFPYLLPSSLLPLHLPSSSLQVSGLKASANPAIIKACFKSKCISEIEAATVARAGPARPGAGPRPRRGGQTIVCDASTCLVARAAGSRTGPREARPGPERGRRIPSRPPP